MSFHSVFLANVQMPISFLSWRISELTWYKHIQSSLDSLKECILRFKECQQMFMKRANPAFFHYLFQFYMNNFSPSISIIWRVSFLKRKTVSEQILYDGIQWTNFLIESYLFCKYLKGWNHSYTAELWRTFTVIEGRQDKIWFWMRFTLYVRSVEEFCFHYEEVAAKKGEFTVHMGLSPCCPLIM